ncbi:hypothetical protein [Taibaiella koreensis]|uniref:hypothetical protein n=1 Tax=Taibaiella koreensis TaxID=1268548 RepID=UPI000E59FBA7|nr:hypothetical protein [Taibaiella koreensis]
MKTFLYPEVSPVLHSLRRSAARLMGLGMLCLLGSCQQLSDSFEETRHPRPEKAATKPVPKQTVTSTHTSSTYTTSTSVTVSDTVTAPERSFFETSAAGWDSIRQQLYDMPGLKGRKLYLYQGFYLYDYQGGIIGISLQDPDRRENVDAYRYRKGIWQREEPVKVTGNIPMKEWLLPLDEVHWNVIPEIWATAKKKAATIEDAGSITHIYFNYMERGHIKEWYLGIRSPRRDYYLYFDLLGNLKKTR